MFVSSWWYYQRCVLGNRAAAFLRGLKKPKYVIGLLVVVAYLGWIFSFAHFSEGSTQSPEDVRANAKSVAAGFFMFQIVVTWFALSSGRGVVFREAEVQLLFPRPFTRWQILRFKWLTTQPGALLGSLIVGVLFSRFGNLSYPCAVLGFWIIQSVLYAHGTLMGLWLARLKAQGGAAARWTSLPAWTLLTAVIASVALGWSAIGDKSGWEALRSMTHSPWLGALMWPLMQMAEMLVAPDFSTLAVAMVVPVLLFAGHAVLVWWLDFRFEDQAIEIAEKVQNIKSSGLAALQSKKELVVEKPRQPWQLAPTGPAWKALVWKNVISLGRLPRRIAIRLGVILLIVVSVIGSMLITKGEGPHIPTRIGFILLGLIGYATLLAPSIVRVDLRIDIPHFDVLKAMPLRGRALILGEIMGSVVVIWIVQAIICVVAAILITREGQVSFPWTQKAPFLVAVLGVFFAIDVALLTGENLMALWLPGFVRLGRGVQTGLEHAGQNLMGALIRVFALLVLFLVPATLGIIVGVFSYEVRIAEGLAAALGAIVFTGLVLAECWLLIYLSEGRYERFDITSENVKADTD